MEINDKRRVNVYGTDGSEESLLEIVNKLSIDNIDAMIVETDLLKAAFGKYGKSNNVNFCTPAIFIFYYFLKIFLTHILQNI